MLRRVVTALLLIPVVLGIISYGPAWLFLLVVTLLVAASIWELMRMLPALGVEGFRLLYPLAMSLPAIWFFWPPARLPFLVACWLAIAIWTVFRVDDLRRGFASASGNLAGLWAIAVPLALVGDFHGESLAAVSDPDRPLQLVMVLVTVWACDSGAYFVGRAIGRRKITPRLSPGKTLEGFIAALISAVLAVAVFKYFWFPERSWIGVIVVGLVIGGAATTGDLFESLIKRGAGVKDTSQLIPGHGGVLDRLDSLLFAFPAYYAVSTML